MRIWGWEKRISATSSQSLRNELRLSPLEESYDDEPTSCLWVIGREEVPPSNPVAIYRALREREQAFNFLFNEMKTILPPEKWEELGLRFLRNRQAVWSNLIDEEINKDRS